MPELDTLGVDIELALATSSGTDGFLFATAGNVTTIPGNITGAPTAFVSASNAVSLDYDGIAYGTIDMTEDTTATITNVADYAQVVLLVVGDADNEYDITFPSAFMNTSDLTVPFAADTKTWVLIYRDGADDTWIITVGDAHVVVT